MKNVDLTYIIPVVTSLISVITVFFYGKRKVAQDSPVKFFRYIPLLSVIALLLGVLYMTYFYQNELSREKEKFLALQQENYYNDSVLISNNTKSQALDSLRILNQELNKMLARIKKQEKITGEYSFIKDRVQAKIAKTNEEIGVIESYNEIIDKPKYLEKGYTTSGNTSNFVFFCPTDKTSDYIDLKLRFLDKTIINKIACIYLTVTEVKGIGENWVVFSQAYLPRDGVNAFKIKNYLKANNIILEIGYVLKTETNKQYPTFEKISCRSN